MLISSAFNEEFERFCAFLMTGDQFTVVVHVLYFTLMSRIAQKCDKKLKLHVLKVLYSTFKNCLERWSIDEII